MAEAADALRAAEDRASDQLNGTPDGTTCGTTKHQAMTRLERLVIWKAIRLAEPHLSSNLTDIETEIRRELRRVGK